MSRNGDFLSPTASISLVDNGELIGEHEMIKLCKDQEIELAELDPEEAPRLESEP